MHTALHERSYALIFHREDSKRDFVDDENDQQLIFNVNEPINTETQYS
ncbi:unnamed protein product, partial [Rotaria sp. Silwood2]